METVTEQPIKKFEFFRCPQSLPGVTPLTKKPEDSGYEIDLELDLWIYIHWNEHSSRETLGTRLVMQVLNVLLQNCILLGAQN